MTAWVDFSNTFSFFEYFVSSSKFGYLCVAWVSVRLHCTRRCTAPRSLRSTWSLWNSDIPSSMSSPSSTRSLFAPICSRVRRRPSRFGGSLCLFFYHRSRAGQCNNRPLNQIANYINFANHRSINLSKQTNTSKTWMDHQRHFTVLFSKKKVGK